MAIRWKQSSLRPLCAKKHVRKITKYNKSKFGEMLHQIDWYSFVVSAPDIDSAALSLHSCIYAIYDLCFPLRVIRIRNTDPPWMKASMKILLDRRDRVFHQGKRLKYLRLREEAVRHANFLKTGLCQRSSVHRQCKQDVGRDQIDREMRTSLQCCF